MIDVPAYRLPQNNIFNFREKEWHSNVVENISRMLVCGEQYGLRVSSITIDDKPKVDHSEIKRTISKMLNINMVYQETPAEGEETPEPKNIALSYEIPWLINNHFYVGGNYKVCIYQLYDKPIIVRNNIIKIRTNIQSFMIEKNELSRRKQYNYTFYLFGKKLPFAKAVIAYYGVQRTREVFSLNENNEKLPMETPFNVAVECLRDDIILILNDATIDKVRLFHEYFPRKTDQSVIEDLNLITKIDIFSLQFMSTPSIVEEFIYVLGHGSYNDMDYRNKRVRFVEQIIYVNLCKDFYNLIVSIKKNRKAKFSINSKSILSAVNVSSIVQFDCSLNPLAELSLLSRTSLVGPGGFEKNNVPHALREIHDTMAGLIDPSDTADREGCGSTQYLLPSVEIQDNGTFRANEQLMTSISVSSVPWLAHDDATRLQMSSSQQRHAIMLKNFDNPLIQTGVEGMYSKYTSFIFMADRDGTVIFLDSDVIIVQYDNKICKAFHIGNRKLYLSVNDFYKVYYSVGQSFKKGDVIAESNYLKNGRIVLGKNVLTAVMTWYGYNYEDAIIVSEKIAREDYFTSIHYVDLSFDIPTNKILLNLNDDYANYKPLPLVGDRLVKGSVFAKIKTVSSDGFEDVIFEPVKEEIVTEDCVITDIRIYANKWDTESFPQYNHYIKTKIDEQKAKRAAITEKLSSYLTKDELERFLGALEISKTEKTNSNYKVKGESIDGIRVEITAVYERKIAVGDKLGNRHGNKGIVSIIVPEEKMPVLPDGRRVELIINTLGIPSRMNIGQLYELHLAMSLQDLKKNIIEKYNTGKKDEIYPYLMSYIDIIDKTANKNYSQQMSALIASVPVDSFVSNISNFFVIQPPFESIGLADLRRAMEYTNTQYEYQIFDPVSGTNIQNTIAVGYQYFLKLNHIAEDKIAARGIGPYSVKTAQPLGGKSRKGGQRLGEMEMWAVIAHGCEKNLAEFTTVKSDSIKLRNKYISDKMGNTDLLLDSDDDGVSQSLRLLQTNLKSLGLDYYIYDGTNELHEEEPLPIISAPEIVAADVSVPESLDLFSHPFGDEKVVYDKSLTLEEGDSDEQ